MRRLDSNWLLVPLLCVFAVAPLTAPGFFLNAHDATIGAFFLWQFDAGIRDGALWPVWGPDMVFGYGYALFMVIAPLAYYLAEGFLWLGLSLVGAIKAVYAVTFVASGLAMYLFARPKLGRDAALVAAVAYVHIPYHLADIYVRADLAEFAALAFFPAILWAADRLIEAGRGTAATAGQATPAALPAAAGSRSGLLGRLTRRSALGRGPEQARYLALTALLYGGLILTHFTIGVIFTPVLVAYMLWQVTAGSRPPEGGWTSRAARVGAVLRPHLLPAAAVGLGLLLAAVFLLPVMAELRYVQTQDLAGGYFSYSKHFVYFSQLLSPFWGFGYAGEGPNDQMPFQLGVIPVVLAIVAVGAVLAGRRATPEDPARRATAFFVLLTVLFLFLMTGISQPLWDVLKPVVAFIQFPWRLLVITALSLSFLAGAVAVERGLLAPLLIVLLILGSYAYTAPQFTQGEVTLAGMMAFQVRTRELLGDSIWVKERTEPSPLVPQYLANQPLTRAVALADGAAATTVRYGGASVEARVQSAAGTRLRFYTRYFPGWRGYVDGAEVPVSPDGQQGLIALEVPAGEHSAVIRFTDTPARAWGKLISLAALASILGLLAWGARAGRRPSGAGP